MKQMNSTHDNCNSSNSELAKNIRNLLKRYLSAMTMEIRILSMTRTTPHRILPMTFMT